MRPKKFPLDEKDSPIDVRNIREQLCDVLFRPSTLSPALRKKELIRLISLWENDGDLRGFRSINTAVLYCDMIRIFGPSLSKINYRYTASIHFMLDMGSHT